MGINDYLNFNDKRTRKYFTMAIYTAVILLIGYFFLRKRNTPIPVPQAQQVPKPKKKEDTRPRISVSGSLINPDSLNTLSKIGRFSRLYLVFKVMNTDDEDRIKAMLNGVPNLVLYRVLFCETDIGYKAVLRQLNPQLHVESNLQLANEMAGYMNAILMVCEEECEQFYQIIEFQDCESMIFNILNDLH